MVTAYRHKPTPGQLRKIVGIVDNNGGSLPRSGAKPAHMSTLTVSYADFAEESGASGSINGHGLLEGSLNSPYATARRNDYI